MPLLQWRLAVWATNNFLPTLRTESDDHQLSRVWHRAGARMEVLHDLRTAGDVDLILADAACVRQRVIGPNDDI